MSQKTNTTAWPAQAVRGLEWSHEYRDPLAVESPLRLWSPSKLPTLDGAAASRLNGTNSIGDLVKSHEREANSL